MYYTVLDDGIETRNEGWVISGRIFGNYNLDKGWGVQFFGFMRGRQVQLQGTQGGFGFYNVGIKKDFNNKKGSVGLALENFLTPSLKMRNELSSSNGIQQRSLTELHNMSFRINISYRIGKMSVEGPQRSRRGGRSINNDDLKDVGDNGGGGMDGGAPQQQRGFEGPGNGSGMRPGSGAPVKVPAGDPKAVVNAVGSWAYTIESPQGGEGTLVIKKEGEAYTVSITNKIFNSNTTLSSIAVNGNELTFAYEVTGPGGNTMPIQVKAIINGDAFDGSMTVGQFGTFPIKAKRE
jgi:hypothetical protein